MNKSRVLHKFLPLAVTVIAIVVGTWLRVDRALKSGGGDFNTHIKAVEDLLQGVNPYFWTLETYANLQNDPGNKGYAYLPGIMYTNSVFYLTSHLLELKYNIKVSLPFLFQVPGLLATIFVCLFFIKLLYAKNPWTVAFCVLVWMFNPAFVLKRSLEGYDSVTVCFLLWSVYLLDKDEVLSGTLYALSIIFKTFPVIVVFIFLLNVKKRIHFILAGAMVFILFSIPFFRSWSDFLTYLQGSLFVHGERFVQGRPYLYYISYYWKIELFRMIPFSFYSVSSIVSGWVLTVVLYFSKILKDRYKLLAFPFVSFYTLTPVLNKSYLAWGIPFFLISSYFFFDRKNRPLFHILNILYWAFCFWYLYQWRDGFHISHPI